MTSFYVNVPNFITLDNGQSVRGEFVDHNGDRWRLECIFADYPPRPVLRLVASLRPQEKYALKIQEEHAITAVAGSLPSFMKCVAPLIISYAGPWIPMDHVNVTFMVCHPQEENLSIKYSTSYPVGSHVTIDCLDAMQLDFYKIEQLGLLNYGALKVGVIVDDIGKRAQELTSIDEFLIRLTFYALSRESTVMLRNAGVVLRCQSALLPSQHRYKSVMDFLQWAVKNSPDCLVKGHLLSTLPDMIINVIFTPLVLPFWGYIDRSGQLSFPFVTSFLAGTFASYSVCKAVAARSVITAPFNCMPHARVPSFIPKVIPFVRRTTVTNGFSMIMHYGLNKMISRWIPMSNPYTLSLISMIIYPFNTIIYHSMLRPKPVLECISTIYRDQGLFGFFAGCGMDFLRGIIRIIVMSKLSGFKKRYKEKKKMQAQFETRKTGKKMQIPYWFHMVGLLGGALIAPHVIAHICCFFIKKCHSSSPSIKSTLRLFEDVNHV